MSVATALQILIDGIGYAEEVAKDVLAEIEKYGTAEKIVSGELVLPHPTDAQRHYDRKHGKEAMTTKEREQQTRIAELEASLDALKSNTEEQFRQHIAATEKRLKAMESAAAGKVGG